MNTISWLTITACVLAGVNLIISGFLSGSEVYFHIGVMWLMIGALNAQQGVSGV